MDTYGQVAIIVIPQFPCTLTLTTTGEGSGTIEANRNGIIRNGYEVTIWANASAGSTFIGFSGSLSGTTSSQVLIVDGNETVNAEFIRNIYSLTLDKGGTGDGTIEASPATGPYHYGDTVTIWANASEGDFFGGFVGYLWGKTTPQILTIDGDKCVLAIFIHPRP